MRLFSLLIFLLAAGVAQAQLTLEPAKPQAGEKITITYIPAGDLASTLAPVQGVVYLAGTKKRQAEDLLLVRSGKKYTATLTPDTSVVFAQFGFFTGDRENPKFDNNFNEGYTLRFNSGDKAKKGSYLQQATFHQYTGSETGVDRNAEKVFADYESEFALYPEQKKKFAGAYAGALTGAKKELAMPILEKEIESALKAGLKTEEDYAFVESLYAGMRLPEQAKMITAVKKEKFPAGKWTIAETINGFYGEQDVAKKEALLATIQKNVDTNPDWAVYQSNLDGFQSVLLGSYAKAKNWDAYSKLAAAMKNKMYVASSANNIAWDLQEKNEDLKKAEELGKLATDYTRSEWKKPTGERPQWYTVSSWEPSRKSTYASYSDTYAMVLFKLGQYKKGYELAKESAITINAEKSADNNNTFALLGEKVLPAKELKPYLERFIKSGKGTTGIKEILKRVYVADKKSEDGYDAYLTALEQESHLAMLAELKKKMLTDAAPSFSMKDLDGKPVNSADLIGKVVIMDFWATWCGPCKASFPGMQKMVTKFKDNPNVKFVFVDTWERVEDKEKNAADFIAANKYTFHVAMDNESKVVAAYKVDGIPTKFVLDKDGKIRFKAVGFSGSDDKLISELSAMIEMASGEKAVN